MLTLYAACLLLLAVLGVHAGVLALVAWRRQDPPLPPPLPEAALPAVTVQLPLYNEVHVAARLIDAVAALDYPRDRLTVQVLDDSDDETTALVAERVAHHAAQGLAIQHVRRGTRAGYKAGALAHGLAEASELVALFDADFVPAPDTLRRLVPAFGDPGVGCVQARWGHLNAGHSALTQAQAYGLDLHFGIEHRARVALGGFFNFNGTAGLWRRACIEDAGGWSARTLAEDLDLSLRAQLRGWRFVYAPAVRVPAELPAEVAAWRTQQVRWARGGAGTARYLLGPLWRSSASGRAKVLGTVHLLSPLAHVATLGLALLHAPVALAAPVPDALALAGMVGGLGYGLAALVARRGTGVRGRLPMPLFLAGMVGLAPSLAVATLAGCVRRGGRFARTAKVGATGTSAGAALSGYRTRRLRPADAAEMALALYALGGGVLLVQAQQWDALPLQALIVTGTLLVAGTGLLQRRVRGRPMQRTLPSLWTRRPVAWNASKMP